MSSQYRLERGAEWRQWDLHIHTPASFHWMGKRFASDPDAIANIELVDEMIAALNAAEPAVFALMDYWTFDGWFALKRRLAQDGSPKLTKRVFPGIELRLMAPMTGRLNAHVLFSDEIADQMLRDFKAALRVELVNRPLSDDALVELARMVGEDKLKHHGFKKLDVDADVGVALRAGSVIAEINCESYKTAIERVPNGYAVGFMPFNTCDGLAEVKWQEHYAYCLGLFKSSPIFEARNLDTWGAFVGERTAGNDKWIDNFQKALGGVPRLAVSGSDAHVFKGIPGDNNKRGYGDFPSGKATWIKADPTFLGLLQAIKEPAKRSFIGDRPDKLREVEENKTFFIDRVKVRKNDDSTIDDDWLAGSEVPLNSDLVAIIGNKGSGKSALADVIALLGNSRQGIHFSFLQRHRFRGRSGEPAKHFIGRIEWLDNTGVEYNLNSDPPEDAVEMVRYIPQGHFENLCNAHVSGQSDAFEKELRSVIFDHTSDAIRLGALDFDQLIERQESRFRDSLIEYRKEMTRLNHEIEGFEAQSQPQVKRALQQLLAQKNKQIEEHNTTKPESRDKPSEQLSPEQEEAAVQIEHIAEKLKSLEDKSLSVANSDSVVAAKLKAIQSVRDRMRIIERQFNQFLSETASDLEILGLQQDSLVSLSFNPDALSRLEHQLPIERQALQEESAQVALERKKLLDQEVVLRAKLNEPQLLYQQNLKAIEQWNEKMNELVGASDAPDTLKGIEKRIAQIDELPSFLGERQERRRVLAGEIFDALDAQRKAREELFSPVQELIQSNKLIRDGYKLQFQAALGGSSDALASELFDLIKQNSGEFRGEDESYATVRRLSEQFDMNKRDDVLEFIEGLNKKIHSAASGGSAGTVGITSILRKDRTAAAVYDLLYGLTYLAPRYSLLFQDTQIEQLSPGQRGALLLIFYLLVDKGRNPIILDQPEENLDNETVVSLLVPVLTEAKKKRQIIMVTHNPNLAVVCDAEQVIHSTFDRKNGSKITYRMGAIENPMINGHVVNVLEGTKPAFNNRKGKYH